MSKPERWSREVTRAVKKIIRSYESVLAGTAKRRDRFCPLCLIFMEVGCGGCPARPCDTEAANARYKGHRGEKLTVSQRRAAERRLRFWREKVKRHGARERKT